MGTQLITCPVCCGTGLYRFWGAPRRCFSCVLGTYLQITEPRRVIIESPYAGAVEDNLAYLQRCIRDSCLRNEAPYASHLMYTQALDDDDPDERALGIEYGFLWARTAERAVFYLDRFVSPGMRKAFYRHYQDFLMIEFRTLDRKYDLDMVLEAMRPEGL